MLGSFLVFRRGKTFTQKSFLSVFMKSRIGLREKMNFFLLANVLDQMPTESQFLGGNFIHYRIEHQLTGTNNTGHACQF